MKTPNEKMLMDFDWFVRFLEKAMPNKPPKVPSEHIWAHAAQMAYDHNPTEVPERFNGFFPKGFPAKEKRALMIHNIFRWTHHHRAMIVRYAAEAYNQLMVHQDGDGSSRGYRIIPNRETAENIRAAEAWNAWNKRHCDGTHEAEDFNTEQIHRLQPKALIERHRMVAIPLMKPKKK